MPVKKVRDLKDPTDRSSGMEWAKALRIPDLTTTEWNYAASLGAQGYSDSEIREKILENR